MDALGLAPHRRKCLRVCTLGGSRFSLVAVETSSLSKLKFACMAAFWTWHAGWGFRGFQIPRTEDGTSLAPNRRKCQETHHLQNEIATSPQKKQRIKLRTLIHKLILYAQGSFSCKPLSKAGAARDLKTPQRLSILACRLPSLMRTTAELKTGRKFDNWLRAVRASCLRFKSEQTRWKPVLRTLLSGPSSTCSLKHRALQQPDHSDGSTASYIMESTLWLQ
jgi:hypothetical protein